MSRRVLKSWWWRPEDGSTNFGDEIGAMVLEQLGYKVKWVTPEKADIFTTGSIISIINEHGKDGAIVWGSGALEDVVTEDFCKRFKVAAVRGYITAKTIQPIGGIMSAAKGDPALLAPLFWKPSTTRPYGLGVIRHMLDTREYPMADIVIDASEPVADVIQKLTSCHYIASSSLHGLILAYAYGIPSMRIWNDDIIGGDWKYMDFLTTQQIRLDLLQQDLIQTLGRELKK